MANKGVEVEQTNGDVGAVGLIAGLLGEAPGGDVEPAIARTQPADERAHRGRADGSLAVLDLRNRLNLGTVPKLRRPAKSASD